MKVKYNNETAKTMTKKEQKESVFTCGDIRLRAIDNEYERDFTISNKATQTVLKLDKLEMQQLYALLDDNKAEFEPDNLALNKLFAKLLTIQNGGALMLKYGTKERKREMKKHLTRIKEVMPDFGNLKYSFSDGYCHIWLDFKGVYNIADVVRHAMHLEVGDYLELPMYMDEADLRWRIQSVKNPKKKVYLGVEKTATGNTYIEVAETPF